MHKTGTTFLQDLLTRNEAPFANAGLLIVRTGRPTTLAGSQYVGNQNLAWQMTSDRRFDRAFGTLEDLERELTASDLADALLTSEDFATVHDRPGELAALRDACKRAGYEPTIIVYLRDQLRYAQSLYAMFVVRGKLPISFDTFCGFIFDRGHVGWAQNRFPFDYNDLLAPFENCFGRDRMIVRAYRESMENQFIALEFVSLLSLRRPLDIAMLKMPGRLNASAGFLEVMRALHGNCRSTRGELETVDGIAIRLGAQLRVLDAPYDAIGPNEVMRFRERFAPLNEAIEERDGVRMERPNFADTESRRLTRMVLRACIEAWNV